MTENTTFKTISLIDYRILFHRNEILQTNTQLKHSSERTDAKQIWHAAGELTRESYSQI